MIPTVRNPGYLNFNSSFSILLLKGFSVRICIHTSFLVKSQQKYCLTSVLGGLGGLGGDATGMSNPLDDLENSLDNLGTRSADFGASQYSWTYFKSSKQQRMSR